MKLSMEKITAKSGKLTAKTVKTIRSAPKKTADKTVSIKDAFVAGYRDGK